ncbi:MAG TPA: hypothetical protein VEC39_05965 [Vicinamibacterales bacterium]|nr:hypothetical protein [Vicinamibacterales bacterium]
MVTRAAAGVLGLWGTVGATFAVAGCSYLPAAKERSRAHEQIGSVPGVIMVTVGCGSRVFASNSVCADVIMKNRATLRFDRVGAQSFGATAVNIFVTEAGGLVPRLASCTAVDTPNFHRSGPLGHHFRPSLIDLPEAITRHRELLTEVQYWPRCPLFWEVQDRRGARYRYCARKPDAVDEPPKPEGCAVQ